MYLKKLSKNINFNSKIVKAKINEVEGISRVSKEYRTKK